MGLISKEVEITLNVKQIKYYEDLGYEIPRYFHKHNGLCVKRGTKILVKVEDLSKNSHVKIKVKCDCCDKEYEIRYQDYIRCNHDGKTYCSECTHTVLFSGENNHKWNHNKTDKERERQRKYPKYAEFVKKVLKRDNYTCQCCGEKQEYMEAHHLDGYNWCKEKRTDETNGITLCKTCHGNFHSIYGKGNNTKEQFEEWLGYTIKELEKYNGKLPTARKIYCIEENKIYDSAMQLADEWNTSFTKVYDVCNHKKARKGYDKSVKGKHILWLDEYEQCTEEDIQKYLDWCSPSDKKQVMCITTGKIFNSVAEASRYYNIKSPSNISVCCKGKKKSAGKLSDKTKLVWKYYEE